MSGDLRRGVVVRLEDVRRTRGPRRQGRQQSRGCRGGQRHPKGGASIRRAHCSATSTA